MQNENASIDCISVLLFEPSVKVYRQLCASPRRPDGPVNFFRTD